MESLGQVVETNSNRRLLTIVNHLSFYQPKLIPEQEGGFSQTPTLLNELSEHLEDLKISVVWTIQLFKTDLDTHHVSESCLVTSISYNAKTDFPLIKRLRIGSAVKRVSNRWYSRQVRT